MPSLLPCLITSAISQDVLNVLIFGWAGSEEDRATTALGYNTTIVTESESANMTTLDFARYDAVVVPNLNTDYIISLKFLEDSKEVWSPAITGSIIVVGMKALVVQKLSKGKDKLMKLGGDPVNHLSNNGAGILISSAVRFAAEGHLSQETTGLYLALSRCFNDVDSATVEAVRRVFQRTRIITDNRSSPTSATPPTAATSTATIKRT